MVISLEELKRQNAETETLEAEAPQAIVENVEVEAAEVETEEAQDLAEGVETEEVEAEVESWMQTEEQASEGERQFSGSDIAAAKKKLRAKIEREKNSEIEELKAKIEALSNARSDSIPTAITRPRPADYLTDEEYYKALDDYTDARVEAKLSAVGNQSTQEAQLEKLKSEISNAVDTHYENAAKLVGSSGINPEVYQKADSNFRNMIDGVMPNQGDDVTDMLISRMGEGSEKVLYFVGRNPSELSHLKNLLSTDKSGLSAAIYLGQKKTELTKPQQKITKAPKPSTQIKGDAGQSSDARALKLKYDKAGKSGDIQARFNARIEAKRNGVDVSNW